MQYAKDKQASLRRRRHRQTKSKDTSLLFTKPEDQVVPTQNLETKKDTKKHHSNMWSNVVKVADVIAWYVNPAIYVLFAAVYFTIGMAIR